MPSMPDHWPGGCRVLLIYERTWFPERQQVSHWCARQVSLFTFPNWDTIIFVWAARVGLGLALAISVEMCGVKPAFEVRRVLFWRSLPSHAHTAARRHDETQRQKAAARISIIRLVGVAGFFLVNFSYFHPPARRKVIVLEIGAGRSRNNLLFACAHNAMEFRRLVWSFAAGVFGGKKHTWLSWRDGWQFGIANFLVFANALIVLSLRSVALGGKKLPHPFLLRRIKYINDVVSGKLFSNVTLWQPVLWSGAKRDLGMSL